ncbi:hypothetical protein TcarDRAFT_1284 [Thermosinus carboxydivorans Nor1]|uniref:Portal protein n=1 Tax=Thermosinus carboxydivorans Nor1 TaxID=401526 RepID=A1HR50_9FIRM|nr:portal protein [Thermosinus carboxydivorans]EAX47549.1 hypothetical protein TcarDRAFT_1284 [Thermosinus carboxydivorans Nor1]
MTRTTDLPPELVRKRNMFRAAIEKSRTWRQAARKDYEFYFGKQWEDADLQALKKQKRPAITINRIRPLINLISGYQRLNRYEPDFKPRTADDIDLCKVRKGITKYIMDSCRYNREESRVFLDGIIGGVGWFEVGYEFDYHALDGKAVIKRVSPFDIYVDPESREPDLSDAEYICRAKWVSKDDLKRTYPEFADEIEAFAERYDRDEEEECDEDLEPLWYSREKKKCRLVEIWYKRHTMKEYYVIGPGQIVTKDELLPGMMVTHKFRVPQTEIRCSAIIGDVELEDVPSPYQHGRFPFAPYFAYYVGEEGEIPAGVVRDLQDIQREQNKRRSQLLHLINTMANRGWLLRRGQEDTKKKLLESGSTPGVVVEYDTDPPKPFDSTSVPTTFAEFEQLGDADFRQISGINEAMLGQEIPSGTSGRAIELRQRTAVTQVAGLFDNLRATKEMVLYLLWGSEGAPGIIPQYYTEEKTFRIIGESGKDEFVTINQRQLAGYDWMGNAIYRTLNDLSVGEFDIVIDDVPATPTQRIAQFYALLELAKLLPPGAIPVDMIIDASDFDNKEELKQRWLEQQRAAAQAVAMKQSGAPPPGQPGQPGIVPQSAAIEAMRAAL